VADTAAVVGGRGQECAAAVAAAELVVRGVGEWWVLWCGCAVVLVVGLDKEKAYALVWPGSSSGASWCERDREQ
jgi:hypothetical protein